LISKIFLISDIHLRPYKRHKEYEVVFKRLLKYIQDTKDENSVICLGGDIVHNKIDISPELIQITSKFLKSCADLLPTIVVLGNHDFLMSNTNRLDALTPIVESLNHPNLHFWRESDVYKLNGCSFSVFSLIGSQDEWVLADKIKAKNKIAIFHGPVIGKNNPNPFIESGMRTISPDKFDGFDLVLLGDLHQPGLFVQERSEGKPEIKYPGSLLCQSFGEPALGHGILMFDVEKRTSEFIEIENDYCYFTLNVFNNEYQIPKKLTKKVRLRVKYENSSIETVNEAIELFSKKFNIVETIRQKVNSQLTSLNSTSNLGNSRDVGYQNEIIEEYLLLQDIDKDSIETIKEINVECNRILNQNQSINRNITWIPKKLEFSNMFSYGENNVVDFADFEGIYGINAGNYAGKSAFLDVLCFSIYDKSTRASKAIHILNNNKTWFKSKFSFDYNGQEFFIERFGQKNEKNGAIRVDVKFWTYDEDGVEKSLNGEDRDQTNKAIREYLGTYDDFVMTALSTQYDNQNFVEKTQRERKELLYKFLDISIYDELFRISKETTKEQQFLIKEFEKENLYDKSSNIYQRITWNENRMNELSQAMSQFKDEIKELNEKIFDLNKKLQSVDNKLNIDEIRNQLKLNQGSIQNIVESLTLVKEEIAELKKQKKVIEKELEGVDIEFVTKDTSTIKSFDEITSKLNDNLKKIHTLEISIENHQKKVQHLNNHEYDPNCEFCCKNEFVIDAEKTREILPKLQDELLVLVANNSGLESQQFVIQLEINKIKTLTGRINNLAVINNKLSINEERFNSLKYQGTTIKEKIKKLTADEARYFEIEEILVKNEEIEEHILQFKEELRLTEIEEEKIQKEFRTVFSNLTSFKKDYDVMQAKMQKYNELVKNNRVYELYTQALGRDGVPYLILEKVMPLIESEVNEVLSQVVNFTVKLESTEEKYIHAYIDYGNGQTWPVELTSGMERFILSLAFRTSLTEITSLPRPPFLAIDEGFGVLDSDNLLSMGKLFEFLKTRYNYLLVISHIDSMKDLVEKKINVEKVNGYSTINVQEN
jgi:DNA repair exonuclease SbcCD ATPase subunit